MTRPAPPRGLIVPAAALGLLAALALAARSIPAVAVINESPSLPEGLYLRSPGARPDIGAVVALAQPQSARPYLASLGMPSETWLLKRVAAVEGDEVCAGEGWTRVRETRMEVIASDRRGAPLAHWTGCRRLEPGELFLLGDTPGSFDSRYFGPVREGAVTGVFREVVRW